MVHVARNNGHAELLVGSGDTGVPAYCLAEYGPQYLISAADIGREWVAAAGGATTFEVCERAVLEVEFHLVVTGTGEDDFTFAVTPRRTIARRVVFRCPVRLLRRPPRGKGCVRRGFADG